MTTERLAQVEWAKLALSSRNTHEIDRVRALTTGRYAGVRWSPGAKKRWRCCIWPGLGERGALRDHIPCQGCISRASSPWNRVGCSLAITQMQPASRSAEA